MLLTLIAIAVVFAVFAVPALLALHFGVDSRTDAWDGRLTSTTATRSSGPGGEHPRGAHRRAVA